MIGFLFLIVSFVCFLFCFYLLSTVLINKLLTACSSIDTIYLLVRNKKGKDVHSRIEDIFDDPVSIKMINRMFTFFFWKFYLFKQMIKWYRNLCSQSDLIFISSVWLIRNRLSCTWSCTCTCTCTWFDHIVVAEFGLKCMLLRCQSTKWFFFSTNNYSHRSTFIFTLFFGILSFSLFAMVTKKKNNFFVSFFLFLYFSVDFWHHEA